MIGEATGRRTLSFERPTGLVSRRTHTRIGITDDDEGYRTDTLDVTERWRKTLTSFSLPSEKIIFEFEIGIQIYVLK